MTFLLSIFLSANAALATVNVVTTTQDLAALANAVGGSAVTADYLARGDLDPHFIDAKPSFMVKLSKADLVLSVGMDLEVGWLPGLLTGVPGIDGRQSPSDRPRHLPAVLRVEPVVGVATWM